MTTLSAEPLGARLAPHLSYPLVSVAPGEGEWHSLSSMLTGDGLFGQFRRLAERTASPPEVQVTHVMGWLAAAISIPMVTAWRLEGVVPLLDPDETFVRPDEGGWFNATAIGEPVTVDGDEATLIRHVTALMEPLVARVLPHSRLGRRTIWAVISDRMWVSLYPRDPSDPSCPDAKVRLESLFAGCGPLDQRRRWTSVDLPPDRSALAPTASACCLAYKSEGGEYCAVLCPKTSEGQKQDELRTMCAR
ncbi:hypothetical protein Afil01_45880 [Actinorhabdospora filicis]|uniref:Ferric iron reductase FhuF-like transporter n=1 Tax=Actinorhabdospora filicis TaxID=1785913 RepID=A0A9W6SS71_9ACTN|nr:(2Fe-2S)-binding protein [Actinorhabdospora filicis]GLZ79781.1 hypothetical protein Afil01_45880 [Actinorhabdospora filicis]